MAVGGRLKPAMGFATTVWRYFDHSQSIDII
jgi:hypothetical protein